MGATTSGGKRSAKVLSPVSPLCARMVMGKVSKIAKKVYFKQNFILKKLFN
jgi:hypothetical protein